MLHTCAVSCRSTASQSLTEHAQCVCVAESDARMNSRSILPSRPPLTDAQVDVVLKNAEAQRRRQLAVTRCSLGTLCHWLQPLNLESTSTRGYAGTWTPSLLGWKSSDVVHYLLIAADMIRFLNVRSSASGEWSRDGCQTYNKRGAVHACEGRS